MPNPNLEPGDKRSVAKSADPLAKPAALQAKTFGEAAGPAPEPPPSLSAGAADAVDGAAKAGREAAAGAAASLNRTGERLLETLGLAGEAGRELTRESSQHLQALAECNSVLARGLQDASREWIQLVRESLQLGLDGMSAATRCRNLPDLLALQNRVARENLEAVMLASRRVSEISLKLADDAAERVRRIETGVGAAA